MTDEPRKITIFIFINDPEALELLAEKTGVPLPSLRERYEQLGNPLVFFKEEE
jgi:hypothetical protein